MINSLFKFIKENNLTNNSLGELHDELLKCKINGVTIGDNDILYMDFLECLPEVYEYIHG